jgi:hypothetical protein
MNLKSFTVFFGIRDELELSVAIVVVSFVIIGKEKKTHQTSLEKNIKQTRFFIGPSLEPIKYDVIFKYAFIVS